mmetsp:Transcript_12034/g.36305  ORF Transcript_12034/g.36305 Transcript_12034/m.36305 type:complete len:220 (-) Transcript_12034:673-1332(-)
MKLPHHRAVPALHRSDVARSHVQDCEPPCHRSREALLPQSLNTLDFLLRVALAYGGLCTCIVGRRLGRRGRRWRGCGRRAGRSGALATTAAARLGRGGEVPRTVLSAGSVRASTCGARRTQLLQRPASEEVEAIPQGLEVGLLDAARAVQPALRQQQLQLLDTLAGAAGWEGCRRLPGRGLRRRRRRWPEPLVRSGACSRALMRRCGFGWRRGLRCRRP